jgi:hypothetical protein
LAALFEPRLDLFLIPYHAPRREIEAARELATLLHLIDGAVGKWHDQPEFMSSDRPGSD